MAYIQPVSIAHAAEIGARPDAKRTNYERSLLDQFRLIRGPLPLRFVAYIGQRMTERESRDAGFGWSNGRPRYPVTTWYGHPVGTAILGGGWRVNSGIAPRMFQAQVTFRGLHYTGRTFGEGMCVSLRITAESLRLARAAGMIETEES